MKAIFIQSCIYGLPVFLALASASLPAMAQNAPPIKEAPEDFLEANEVLINEESGRIEATGNAEISSGEKRLTTQKLFVDRVEDKITVPEALMFSEADGSVIRADSAEIDNRLERGVFKNLQFTTEGARLQSATAERNGMQLSLKGAVFTSCPVCEDPEDAPLWQIRAGSIDYDRAAQNISYRHSRLEVFGLPLFYLPYMAHAGPEVDRRSGVLTPSLGNGSGFGAYVDTPYFFDLAPNYDLTLTPRISEKQDPMLQGEWRHLTRSGEYQATAYIHQPQDELGEDTERATRGGLLADGQFRIGNWQYDFDIQQASDALFFKRYKIFDPARLTSSVKAGRKFGRHALSLEAFRFDETISEESVSALMPRISHGYNFKNRLLGGRLSVSNIFTQQQRDDDVDTGHLASLINWSWRHTTQGGFVWTANNRLALDAYDFTIEDGDDKADAAEEAEEFLSANSFAVKLAYPLRRETAFDRQTLSPQVQLVLADNDDGYDDIPFIDSATSDLTQAQLFRPLSPKDEASRVNLGLDHTLELGPRLSTRLFLGQSYNLSDTLPSTKSGSGYDTDGNDRSALLANSALYAGPLSLSHEARFTDDGGDLLRSQSRLGLAFQKFDFAVDHSFYEAGQQGSTILEEATGSLGWQMGQNWRLDASLSENLETKQKVRAEAAFTYEDDCTLASITINRDYSRFEAIEPDTSINFTFTLKTISN